MFDMAATKIDFDPSHRRAERIGSAGCGVIVAGPDQRGKWRQARRVLGGGGRMFLIIKRNQQDVLVPFAHCCDDRPQR